MLNSASSLMGSFQLSNRMNSADMGWKGTEDVCFSSDESIIIAKVPVTKKFAPVKQKQ